MGKKRGGGEGFLKLTRAGKVAPIPAMGTSWERPSRTTGKGRGNGQWGTGKEGLSKKKIVGKKVQGLIK